MNKFSRFNFNSRPSQLIDEESSTYWLPLADVLLVLIAFMALIVPIKIGAQGPIAGYLPVRIADDGTTTIQGQSVPLERLPAVAAAYASRNPQGRLRLLPDPQAQWGELRPVLLMLRDTPTPVELRLQRNP
jgi:biopolymer transport protein ExbD